MRIQRKVRDEWTFRTPVSLIDQMSKVLDNLGVVPNDGMVLAGDTAIAIQHIEYDAMRVFGTPFSPARSRLRFAVLGQPNLQRSASRMLLRKISFVRNPG